MSLWIARRSATALSRRPARLFSWFSEYLGNSACFRREVLIGRTGYRARLRWERGPICRCQLSGGASAYHSGLFRNGGRKTTAQPCFQWFLGPVSFVSASEFYHAANDQATPINIGDLVAGEIASPGEADTFEFDAVAGQFVFLDRTASRNRKRPELLDSVPQSFGVAGSREKS